MTTSQRRSMTQAESGISIPSFTTMVHDMLDRAWGQDWGRFLPAFPNGTNPQSATLPIITYSYEKEPGIIGHNGTRDVRPSIRDRFTVEENGETRQFDVYAQVFDVQYTLDVWHTSSHELDELIRDLERFFLTYQGFFRESGVRLMRFQSLGSTPQTEPWRDDVIGRSLTYFMQFEDQHAIPVEPLERVRTYVDGLTNPFAST